MAKKKTSEEYYNECKSKGYDLPIEDYVNSRTKINHKCNKCGNIYEQTPKSHLKGSGCPLCGTNVSATKRRKSPENYYNECKSKGYDLPIEHYVNTDTKIKHRCIKGHVYEQTPSNHLQGHGCPKCSGNTKKTSCQYYNECKSKGYDLPIEHYVNTDTKIKHRCIKGHVYEQTPHDHLRGKGCPNCNGTKKKTPKGYYNLCKSKGYDIPTEDYINNKTKIKHKCNKGHIYFQTPSDHLQEHGCPICNESHGEKYICNYLNRHSIKYTPQKNFHDLKDKTYLSYDFYLPDYSILIEYQGIQHYESINFKGNSKYTNLEKQQLHDKLKREYAKEHGYKLLELHYSLDTQDKVDKYLSRRIKG